MADTAAEESSLLDDSPEKAEANGLPSDPPSASDPAPHSDADGDSRDEPVTDDTDLVAANAAAPPPAAAANGVAHPSRLAPPLTERASQPASDSDDDDLPLNARLQRAPANAGGLQLSSRGGQRDREEGAEYEGLDAAGSVDSAAAMADAVITAVAGTSSVAAAAGAHVRHSGFVDGI
jgi:hypothetical protein